MRTLVTGTAGSDRVRPPVGGGDGADEDAVATHPLEVRADPADPVDLAG